MDTAATLWLLGRLRLLRAPPPGAGAETVFLYDPADGLYLHDPADGAYLVEVQGVETEPPLQHIVIDHDGLPIVDHDGLPIEDQ